MSRVPVLRREFLAVGGAIATTAAIGLARAEDEPKPRRVTLAQIVVGDDVAKNLARILAAIDQAERDDAEWILFPEGALSGYRGGFDQATVEKAFEKVRERCATADVNGLIGTCWREGAEKPHNEIRIVDRRGKFVGKYAKTCLTYSDAKDFAVGEFSLVHDVDGLTIGTLICNDLWVTPGYTDGPNPHLTLKQAKAGAQAIFHAVNSGGNQKFRAYHESNQMVRAAEAKCPIVTVNAAVEQGEVNCTSGVVLPTMEHGSTLPRKGEQVATVEFAPKSKQA